EKVETKEEKKKESHEKKEDSSDDDAAAAVGAQVELLTYNPFGEAAGNVLKEKTKWKDVLTLNLHEMSSARDLKSVVEGFFQGCSEGSVFLLQCDPQASSLRRIEHAKYIIERERMRFAASQKFQTILKTRAEAREKKVAEKKGSGMGRMGGMGGMGMRGGKNDKSEKEEKSKKLPEGVGIHVIVLIHLQRGDLQFLLDYSNVWRQAFIDDLDASGDTGLPDLQAMLQTSLTMTDIVGTLDLPNALMNVFRSALGRMVYRRTRTVNDVQGQIKNLMKFLEEDNEFLAALDDTVRGVITKSGAKLDVMAATSGQVVIYHGSYRRSHMLMYLIVPKRSSDPFRRLFTVRSVIL
ncbi:hypothetical protein AAMO2058_000248500, partial [Amorphochlora amoebiformis]